MADEVTHAQIISEIRAHRAEYKEAQRRQDDVAGKQAEMLLGLTEVVTRLDREVAVLTDRIRGYDALYERVRALEHRQWWWSGAAAVAGALLSFLWRRLSGGQ